jgi:cell division protein FtsA
LERTIAAIDIGTSKICTLVGEVGDGGLRVIGVGVVPSKGLRKGVVTDVQEAAQAIGESVRKAERVSGCTVSRAIVGVGGTHVASQNSNGMVAIGKGDRPIDRDDTDRALEAAQAIPLDHNRRIVHAIPRTFVVDGQDGITNPIGLMGFRLEVEAHIVTGASSAIQNLVRCVEMNDIGVSELVLQPLASAEAVLTSEEREMGVALVDIGGGTTDMAVFVQGSIWQTLSLGMGGNHITNDLAVGLRAPFNTAEDVKVRYAHALVDTVDEQDAIEVATFGETTVSSVKRREVCGIAVARAKEMLEAVGLEIKRSGLDGLLPAGYVLTGGTADLPGLRELAVEILQVPVRVGVPRKLQGLVESISSPAYATAVGLLLWGMNKQEVTTEIIGLESKPKALWYKLLEVLKLFLPKG